MISNHLLLIQVGTPPDDIRDPLGDFPLWFHRVLRHPGEALHVVRVFEGEHLPAPKAVRGAIITGSWHMVTERLPWSEATAHWIRDAMAIELPLFGICYGHQLIAHALGGRVDYHPQGREIGTRTIRLLAGAEDDPLLQAMPVRFSAHLTHVQTIIDLPTGARALAASDHDRHQMFATGQTPSRRSSILSSHRRSAQRSFDCAPKRCATRAEIRAHCLLLLRMHRSQPDYSAGLPR